MSSRPLGSRNQLLVRQEWDSRVFLFLELYEQPFLGVLQSIYLFFSETVFGARMRHFSVVLKQAVDKTYHHSHSPVLAAAGRMSGERCRERGTVGQSGGLRSCLLLLHRHPSRHPASPQPRPPPLGGKLHPGAESSFCESSLVFSVLHSGSVENQRGERGRPDFRSVCGGALGSEDNHPTHTGPKWNRR